MSKVKVLGDEIYLYENFLSKEEVEKINNTLKNLPEEKWNANKDYPVPSYTSDMEETDIIKDRLAEIIDGYKIHDTRNFVRLRTGEGWGSHTDNIGFIELREKSKMLKDNKPFKLVKNTNFGIVVYINDDYEGGEIYYEHQNIQHKPKPGDLIIHSSEENCLHGVKKVTSGTRLSYSNNLFTYIKVPLEDNE